MPKVTVIKTETGEDYLTWDCPGCGHSHGVPAARWSWNGDVDRPTLSPSVRHLTQGDTPDDWKTTCHYFVEDGRIRFCHDSKHELAGATVEMAERSDDE